MKKSIPDIIVKEAASLGYNDVSFEKVLDGKEVYSVGSVDENGNPIPEGLPAFLLYDSENIEHVCGEEGLDLCSRLD